MIADSAQPDGARHSGRAPSTSQSHFSLYAVLLITMAASALMQFALGVLAPFITAEFDITRTAFGSATSVLFLSGLVVSLAAARLVERWGEVRLLRALHLAIIAAFLLVALAPSWEWVFVGVVVMGLPLGVGNPVTNALIVHRVDAAVQGTATGIKQSGVQVGALIAGLSAPAVAAATSWRIAAAMLGALAVVGVALSARLNESPLPPEPTSHTPQRHWQLPPLTWYLTVYAVFMGWGVSAIVAFLPLYAFEDLGMPAHLAGLLTGVIGLLGALSRVAIGVLANTAQQLGRWLIVLAGAAAVSTPLLLAAARLPHLVWIAVIGLGAGAIAWQSPAMITLVRLESQVARSSGLVMAGFFTGMLTGPLAFGRLADETGTYAAGWLAVSAAFVLATVLSCIAAYQQR